MADNLTTTTTVSTIASGTVVGTDDCAGVHIQKVKLIDGTADSTAVIPGDATNGLFVNVTKLVPGTGATNIGKAEDAGHTTGDTGVMALAVRTDTLAALATTTADYIPLITDSVGALWSRETYKTPNGDSLVNDVNDSVKVEVVSNLTTGGTLDTDDGTVAKSQSNVALNIALPYTDDGSSNMTRTGCSISRTLGAGSTNSTNVKASAGVVYNILCSNINAAAVYLKLYNKATAPTVGTDVPVMTLLVPGSTTGAGMAFDASNINGVPFATGIGFGLTTAIADNSTAAVSANEQIVHIFYK